MLITGRYNILNFLVVWSQGLLLLVHCHRVCDHSTRPPCDVQRHARLKRSPEQACSRHLANGQRWQGPEPDAPACPARDTINHPADCSRHRLLVLPNADGGRADTVLLLGACATHRGLAQDEHAPALVQLAHGNQRVCELCFVCCTLQEVQAGVLLRILQVVQVVRPCFYFPLSDCT